MKKSLTIIKWIALSTISLIVLVVIWLAIPRIKYKSNSNASNLNKSRSWNSDTLNQLKAYTENATNVDAFVAIHNSEILFESGEVKKLINLHSARKPIISLLFGIANDKGLLNLNETLRELDINEHGETLSEQEASATIRDLLMARSGVYLEADAETEYSKNFRPKRNQYKPGEFYFYNNFDFNALGTILKIKTGMSFGECLYQWLALPLGMQEFYPSNVNYGAPFSFKKTDHPAYQTWMSARDLARIGVLISNKGIWEGERIISEAWIKESTKPHHYYSNADNKWPQTAYAYLWSIDTENSNIWGTGYGGQILMIDTTHKITIVQRHFTGNSLLSQGLYLRRNTQSSNVSIMNVWYKLMRNIDKVE